MDVGLDSEGIIGEVPLGLEILKIFRLVENGEALVAGLFRLEHGKEALWNAILRSLNDWEICLFVDPLSRLEIDHLSGERGVDRCV